MDRKEKNLELYDELSHLNNELINVQRKLVKKNVELEHLNELKNQMFGMAAHELRTPLNVILSFSTFLLEEHEQKPCFTDEQYELLNAIKNSSEHMVYILEEMLDISAVESGKINLKKEPIDVVELVKRMVRLNFLPAGKKHIDLVTELPGEPVIRDLDPNKFEQAMNNLISNAIKYSHSGTKTTIGVSTSSEGNQATIYVQDEGHGIPKEQINSLFQPFSKGTHETTAGEKSSGLGLAITKKIVEAHGGRIRVQSEVGTGTTFYIDLR